MLYRVDSQDAALQASPAALLRASSRNLVQRGLTAAFVVLAAVAHVPPLWTFAWLAVFGGLGLVEGLLLRSLKCRGEAAVSAQLAVVVFGFLGSVHAAAAVAMFWLAGPASTKLFAVVLLCATATYILMQFYARPRLFWIFVAPQLAAMAAGVVQMGLIYAARGDALAVLTPLAASAVLFHLLYVARHQLAASRAKLREARRLAREQEEAAHAASAAKSAFLAMMSHEIRTPLNGVLGLVDVVAAGPVTTVQKQSLDVMRESGEALLCILGDLLDISKIEAGKLQLERVEVDLGPTLCAALRAYDAMASARGLRFAFTVQPQAQGRYWADPVRLRQIVHNLVGNALKFTERGEISVAVTREDGVLVVAVTDTGCGIAEARLAELFQPFVQADLSTTRRFGGSGLGLAICRELARLMGGDITVRSLVGEGSCFTVRLPLEAATAMAQGVTTGAAAPPRALTALPGLRPRIATA